MLNSLKVSPLKSPLRYGKSGKVLDFCACVKTSTYYIPFPNQKMSDYTQREFTKNTLRVVFISFI